MNKYTKDEMVERGICVGKKITSCLRCPFKNAETSGITAVRCYQNGEDKYRKEKEQMKEKYTKEEMLDRGICNGTTYTSCPSCPFNWLDGSTFGCYNENIVQYKKDKLALMTGILINTSKEFVLKEKYTKEEMLDGGHCSGRVSCEDCPFEEIGGEMVYEPNCYKQNIAQYKKEKEPMKQENKIPTKKQIEQLELMVKNDGCQHIVECYNEECYFYLEEDIEGTCCKINNGNEKIKNRVEARKVLDEMAKEETKPSHLFKAGVKYFTRDKKRWRRFIGGNLDTLGNVYTSLVFTCSLGTFHLRALDGTAEGLQSSSLDILPEEWTEPKPEFKPYSVDVWLDTATPTPNPEEDFLKHRLIGDSVYDCEETSGFNKFKITVEKAED